MIAGNSVVTENYSVLKFRQKSFDFF